MKNLFGLMVYTVICFFQVSVHGQHSYSITGEVSDEAGHPLPGASISIAPGNSGTVSDTRGEFTLPLLKSGEYRLTVSYMGYEDFHQRIIVKENMELDIKLSLSTLSLQEVVVVCQHDEQRKREEPLNIEIVNDVYLKQNLGGSLMGSLERLPGVTTIDIGSGQSKPVIRGLGFNQVVVVENGIKHEAQQWGADHGLEIDQYAVDYIEVIKGPASLMYGSDAIGGIIDMKSNNIPAENTFGGTVDLTGKTNNDFLGTSVSLYGRKKWFFASARATLLDYGDYKVPTDSVDLYSYRVALHNNQFRNTAGKEQNLHTSIGVIKNRFQSKFSLGSVNSKGGFFANAHGLEPRSIDAGLHDGSNRDILFPYHKVNHFKIINTTRYQWKRLELETNLGFQRNFRQEWSPYVSHGWMPAVFPDTLSFRPDLERQFEKHVYSGNLKITFHVDDQTHFKVGINSEHQDNRIDGRGFIIPAYRQLQIGSFVFARHTFSQKSSIQAGIRYDYGQNGTDEYFDWYPSRIVDEVNKDTVMRRLQRAGNIDREFTNLSWSLGYNHNTAKWSLKTNIGKSFRMPISKEFAANGVDNHMFRYVVGNPGLSPEASWQFDAGVEYNSKKLAIGTTPFLNYFSNYIYLNPTPDLNSERGGGLQEFHFAQSEVFRYGAEIHAHYELFKSLQLGILGEYVYSEQMSGEKKGFTLPFSPPPSGIFNIKYRKRKIKFVENAYVSIDYRVTAPQNDIVPPEETTRGYQVINLGLGGDIVFENQRINISMQVQNLMNTRYFNHTSYYRLINAPEAGRNFIVNISIPFVRKMKQE
jgi:iron complex outermembrane recepter protein